ncbi:lantibiotic dehydratase [Microtetraspora niveoalba]|uniref:lantibiotic dehydratase n=1 Tax=Microtetraspora niveoalba TaxID=46175 RepID=UPI00082A1150|nr:lantibiotic dehydratase [Microtetraspora niveoalba]
MTKPTLGDTGWTVWPDALLRTTGFPAAGLDAFAAPAAAAAAEDLLAGHGDAEVFDEALADAIAAGAAKICEIAADPLFREAVTWQNPGMLVALDGLVAGGPHAARNVRRRDRERAVARYWQRYCAKNETIGFFGPVCWITVADTPRALDVRPGPALLRERRVTFESWALTAYADHLAADARVRACWPPALLPHLTLHERTILRPMQPPLALSAAEADLLARCDGRTPASDVVAVLPRPEDGYLLLERLVERDLITWDAALPIGRDAEPALRHRITTITDPDLRDRATTGLDRLCAARDAVTAAASDPDTLKTALAALDEEFTALTGAAPRRRDGQMYAGRTLCYEDTTRDLDVTVGTTLLDDLAAPLNVLLTTARWLTAALAGAYETALRELYDDLREGADGPVRLSDLLALAPGLFWGEGRRPADEVAEEFARRWERLFGIEGDESRVLLSSADLAEPLARLFPAERPGWSAGRLHSPDLQICAPDVDAVNRGDYQVVLGEMHAAWATFDCDLFTAWHPDVDRLRDMLTADLGPHRIRLLRPDTWPRHTGRLVASLTGTTDRMLGFAAAAGADPDRLLPATSVTVADEDGDLVATAPDGSRRPLIEMFSEMLSTLAVDAFKITMPGEHTPRITIDRLVVTRETWRTTIGATGLGGITDERGRYLATRAWRNRLNLPDRVFIKIGTEVKPCYFDLTSPHYTGVLCTMLRTAGPEATLTISEALPTPDQAWVPDHKGERYFSELRLQITDPLTPGGAR